MGKRSIQVPVEKRIIAMSFVPEQIETRFVWWKYLFRLQGKQKYRWQDLLKSLFEQVSVHDDSCVTVEHPEYGNEEKD